MTPTLRDYQCDGINRIRSRYASGVRRIAYCLPTGGGKTIMFTYIAENVSSRKQRALILVHRRELLRQASDKLSMMKVPHGMISPDHRMTRDLIQVGSVQTVVRRLDLLGQFNLIIFDECHHIMAESWHKIAKHYHDSYFLGVTATPVRLDGKPLGTGAGGLFDELILGPDIIELTKRGYLTDAEVYCPDSGVCTEGIKTIAGDYAKDQIDALMDKPIITGCAITHYRKYGEDMPAIAFCASVKHAKHVAEQFNESGIRAMAVDGGMTTADRDHAVKSLANGSIQVITSCDIISEGVDIPVAGCAILLRPTQSIGLHLQQCGRVLRPFVGKKHSIILDHVGNCLKHGLPHEVREWDLNAAPKKKGGGKKDGITVRRCPQCFHAHIPAPTCPKCGFVYPIKAREIEQVEGELRKLNARLGERLDPIRMLARREQGMAKELQDLLRIARQRGYEPGWAHQVWRSRLRKKQQREQINEGALPGERDHRSEECDVAGSQVVFNFS